MTRTLTLNYLGVTYQIKIRTIANSDMSNIVVWRDETSLSGTSFHGAKSNKEAKIMAERMIEEYNFYMASWYGIKHDAQVLPSSMVERYSIVNKCLTVIK